jgi:hypothetical protein
MASSKDSNLAHRRAHGQVLLLDKCHPSSSRDTHRTNSRSKVANKCLRTCSISISVSRLLKAVLLDSPLLVLHKSSRRRNSLVHQASNLTNSLCSNNNRASLKASHHRSKVIRLVLLSPAWRLDRNRSQVKPNARFRDRRRMSVSTTKSLFLADTVQSTARAMLTHRQYMDLGECRAEAIMCSSHTSCMVSMLNIPSSNSRGSSGMVNSHRRASISSSSSNSSSSSRRHHRRSSSSSTPKFQDTQLQHLNTSSHSRNNSVSSRLNSNLARGRGDQASRRALRSSSNSSLCLSNT